MKKTLFLSAILGVALCSSAFAASKTTVTSVVDGVTYNGGVYTFSGTGAISGSTHTAFVDSNDGSIHAGDTTGWTSFASNKDTYGHTIRLTTSGTYESNFSPFSFGGLITEGYEGTATLGRPTTKVEITGSGSVVMTIKADVTILGNNGIEVFDSGAWTVGSGKTLTLSSTSDIKIDANKTVSLSGEGTTVFNGKLVMAGNLTNGGTATISKMSLEGGSLTNNGTLNLNNAVITATDAALSDKHMVDYTGATSTTGGFSAGTMTVLTNGQNGTVSGSGTLSYGGADYTVDNDHTTFDVAIYTTYTLNSGHVDMGAAAQMATNAGAAAPTSLILDTADAKTVDMAGFTTALTAQAKNGTTTVTNANDSSANFELLGGNAKLVFSGDTAQTIGKLQGNAVSKGFEVSTGASLTASEISGGWYMENQVVDGELRVTGDYTQKVARTTLLQGAGSMVVDGTYSIGNNTHANITLAKFTAAATTIEIGNNNLACSLTIKDGAIADLGNVTGVVKDNVTGTMTLNVTGATLTHAGESAATVADNLVVNIGNTTIAGAGYDFAGNVKLTGTITNTATTLGLQGTLSADALDVFMLGEDVQYSNAETGNGYMTGSYVVVKGANTGTTVAADTLTVGETSYNLVKGDNITIAVTGIGDGTYFINNDAVYGSDAAMTAADTTAITLNGGKLTINEGTAVSKTIKAAQTGTVVLNSGAELNKTSVSASADAKVKLDGEGTYVLNNNGLGTGVELSEAWTGTVKLVNTTVADTNLGNYANENSVVELNGVSGYLAGYAGGSCDQNLKLTNYGETKALVINNGSSTTAFTFKGALTGEGTFATIGTNDPSLGGDFVFTGDLTAFKGNFERKSARFLNGNTDYSSKSEGILQFGANDAAAYAGTAQAEEGVIHNIAGSGAIETSGVLRFNHAKDEAGNKLALDNSSITARYIEFNRDGGDASYVVNAALVGQNETAANNTLKVSGGEVTVNGTMSNIGNVVVGSATLDFSAQAVTIDSLTLNAGSVIEVSNHSGSLTTSALTTGALTEGTGININANLVITDNATLALGGVITMGCDLKLGTGITLDSATIASVQGGNTVTLFTSVEGLTLGTTALTMGDSVQAETVFANLLDGQQDKYFLNYIDGGQDGGIVTLSMTIVPEPATATLSLLALAGLAARRRRH